MTPDLYGAWLTAGNTLQPYGAWIARNWPNLTIAILLAVAACWSIRKASRRVDTILADELPAPATSNARKED